MTPGLLFIAFPTPSDMALARIRECGGATIWHEDHYSAIPGDCCSTKGRADHQPPLAAVLVQIYGGSLTEFVGEKSLTALIYRIGPGIPEIKPLRDAAMTPIPNNILPSRVSVSYFPLTAASQEDVGKRILKHLMGKCYYACV